MSFDPPIRRLVVEAFRGFRDRQEFNLSASAVVVAGPNGTGKTSLFDALQWCLLGSIQRLEGLRARRNVEHIVNQYRLSDRAFVEVELLLRGSVILVRRTGDHSQSTLEFREDGANPLFGDDASSALEAALVPEGLTLEMALTTSGLMQQDVMRAVLEAKPADRYRHITTVLGLGALEDFEEAAQEVAREAKTRADSARVERDAIASSLEQARARLAAAEQRLQSLPRLDALRIETLSSLRNPPASVAIGRTLSLESSDDARSLSATVGELIDGVESFSAAWSEAQRVGTTLEQEPPESDLTEAADASRVAVSEVTAALKRLASAEARLTSAQSASDDLARLASQAIPLLTDLCPVCGQAIDAAHVERDLRERASDTETMLALRAEIDEARAVLEAVQSRSMQAQDTVKRVEYLRSQWVHYRELLARADRAFTSLTANSGSISISADDSAALAQTAGPALDFLRMARRRFLEFLNTLDQASDRGPIDRAVSEVGSLSEALESRTQRLEEDSQRAQVLKLLAESSVNARVEVTENRFRAVQPLVADIFSRLDPHPAFKTIEFELDTYYRRGTTSPMVRDLVEGISADPLVVFSTSQANIAALSYFLAMGLSAGERGLPFVLLDDPVQSMDDVNVLGFADLCRHLRKSRQLIISTHERRFSRLLERKLAPRSEQESTQILEFVGWDRSGPSVDSRVVEAQLREPIRVVGQAS